MGYGEKNKKILPPFHFTAGRLARRGFDQANGKGIA